MADDTHQQQNDQTPSTRHNPYEDADPIPIRGSQTHRDASQGAQRVRSRSVQSAQDAARSQERMTNLPGGVPHLQPARPNRSTGPQTYGQRAAQPQPARQASHIGYSPAGNLGNRTRPSQDPGYTLRTRRKTRFGVIAASMILAIIILAALLWWINRPVPVTVNGTPAEVRVGSSLGDVLHEEEISVNPGNYVSVSGNVLKANMGHEFSATVNGEALSPEDAEKYRVGGSESIDFSDGQDITEEFTAESEVLKPYLRMEGSGYSIQYISQWGRPGELQHRKGKESGESADVVVKEAQDCVITCMEPSPQGDTKYIALTFDDGPLSPYTEQYLDIMEKYGVKATFFNLGENTQANPELARRVVQEGHQLSNHTMAHNQLTSVDAQTIYNEITRSAKVIEDATGVHTTHIRPPYGDFTERSWLGAGGSITATIRWNGDSEDWRLPGPEAIVNNSLVNLHSGTIVLMHDGGGDRSQDVDALPALIERAQSEGYQFVTISDLMRACGLPEDICSGTASMPEDAVWPEEIHPDDIAAAAAAS